MIAHVIAEFEKEFVAEKHMASTTWWRDVDYEITDDYAFPGLLPWGMVVPKKPTSQLLNAIKLKWSMDVDETFYLGDVTVVTVAAPLGVKGLLNGEFGNRGSNQILLDPTTFANKAVNGTLIPDSRPCKWLSMVGAKQFTYDREKLSFKLLWPKLMIVGGVLAFAGGIAPLAWKE